MTWIQTKSGRALMILEPRAEQIATEDIVYGLSFMPRFSGQLAEFYCVAEHSVHVANRVRALGGTIQEQQWGLMHDAPEAYLGDMVAPLKRLLPDYGLIERAVMEAVAEAYQLDGSSIPAIVKDADLDLLVSEKATLLGPEPLDWGLPPREPIQRWKPRMWSPEESRRRFGAKMAELGIPMVVG